MTIVNSANTLLNASRRMAIGGVLGIAALGFGGQASAADLAKTIPGTAAIVTAPFSWTGFYGGLKIGAASVNGQWTSLTFNTDLGRTYSGLLLGARLGYNHQMANNLVLGAEIEGNLGALSGSRLCANANFNCIQAARLLSSATLRLGYAMDRWMAYASGGLAYGAFDIEGRPLPGSNLPLVPFTHNSFGWTVGAGIEYALNNNVILDVGYKYYDFGAQTIRHQVGEVFRTQPRAHTVQVGLSYKF